MNDDKFASLIILLFLIFFIYVGSILWNIYCNLELILRFSIINSIKGWVITIYIFCLLYSLYIFLENYSYLFINK